MANIKASIIMLSWPDFSSRQNNLNESD